MAILKSSEGVRINLTNSTSANYGCRTWFHTCTSGATSPGNVYDLMKLTQTATPTFNRVALVQRFMVGIRTAAPQTEIPVYVRFVQYIMNTTGNPSVNYDFNQGSGGNGITAPQQGCSGNYCMMSANGNSTTGINVGTQFMICSDSWDFFSVTIVC